MDKMSNHDQPQSAKGRKRPGAPKGNQNGRKHGFYSKLHPTDFVDTLDLALQAFGRAPFTPAQRRGIGAVIRDPRMSTRLLVDTYKAAKTIKVFMTTINRILELKRR